MVRGNIRRWIVICLLFSCATLLWFTINVQRRKYWFAREWMVQYKGRNETYLEQLPSRQESQAIQIDSKVNDTSVQKENSNQVSSSPIILSVLPIRLKTSGAVTKKYAMQSTKIKESNASQTASIKSPYEGKIQTSTHTTQVFDADASRVTPQCSLSWNSVGLDANTYETEDITVIRPTGQSVTGSTIKPIFQDSLFRLDPERFLLPVVTWGPNNQLIGLWEGVFVAIKLNRTLVLPRFRKHNTDRQWKRGKMNRIPPTLRLDVESLCKYVSCITLDDFQKTCNYSVDAILNIRFLKMKQIRDIESNIRMKILPQGEKDESAVTDLLVPRNGTTLEKPILRFSADEIKDLFHTPKRCVIEPFPFFDLLTRDKSTTVYNHITRASFSNSGSPEDEHVLANIMKNSQQPLFIRDIVKDFVSKEFEEQPFISAHWRYNEGDYMADWHCNAKEENAKRCAKARSYSAHDFANRLDEVVTRLKRKGILVGHIYIAAPRSGNSMLANLSKVVNEKNWKLFSSEHLENFLKEKHGSCEFVVKNFEDILSSVEMEICSRGAIFLGSLGSSWTGNVHKSRIFEDQEAVNDSKDYIFRA